MNTCKWRSEHSRIIVLGSQLGGCANDIKLPTDADDVRDRIRIIDDLIQAHLASEDAHLYPGLMASPDSDVRALAAAGVKEMSGLAGVWADYRDRWTSERMLADPRRFAAATLGVMGALSLRMEMENDILYPALDQVWALAGRSAA